MKERLGVIHDRGGFRGGIEKYIIQLIEVLDPKQFAFWGVFEEKGQKSTEFTSFFEKFFMPDCADWSAVVSELKEAGVTTVCIHKLFDPDKLALLNREFRTIVFVHDHDYYCLRHHKYFPWKRKNCQRAFNPLACSICSCLLERRGEAGQFQLINLPQRMRLLDTLRQCDEFVVLSEFMANQLKMNKISAAKIHKIHPGYAVTENEASKGDQLMYAGQLIRGKGVDLLLRGLALTQGDFELNIYGGGNDEAYLRELAAQLDISHRVHFQGYATDLKGAYQGAAVVVVPSRWQEPFGLVGLEAMAAAKPVVGFDVGGISEWLKDGENGRLVPLGDVAHLASVLDELMANEPLRQKLGTRGREMVQGTFSEQRFVEKMIDLLRGV